MDKLIIEGGFPLQGKVRISGSKNAALPLMAASILASGPLVLANLPHLGDLSTMRHLLTFMGGVAEVKETPGLNEERLCEISLKMDSLNRPEAPHEMVKTMRASALVLGPLLARFGQARVSLPGGCAIGVRPIDMHLKALKEMGAEFDLSGGDVLAQAPPEGLRGANIHFETVTVTGTENIMMAAVLARGRTVISNAAREPEVGDTARALVAMGAKITGLDSDILTIEGVETLQGTKHVVMPDRIEAGTFIIAVALAGGSVCLEAVPYEALNAVLSELKEAGLILEQTQEGLLVTAPAQGLTAVSVTTQPYPGFPTDMQAQFMALMTKAEGVSLITETIFENRFMHVSELKRLGADIRLDQRTAVVKGVKTLSGAPMTASDLRASASLLLAALGAQGQSEIFRVYHLDRGYDELDKKLNKLGARIKRVKA